MNWRRMLAVSLLLATAQDVSAACIQNSVPATPVVPAAPLAIPRALIPALRTAAGQAAAGSAAGTPAAATTPAAAATSGTDETAAAATTATAAESGTDTAATAQAAASEQARKQLLQKLEFDRRPSAILAAWAGPAAAGGAPLNSSAVNAAAAATSTSGPAEPRSPASAVAPELEAAPLSAASSQPADSAAPAAVAELQQQLQTLQLAVTRGSWSEVGQLLTGFSESERLLIHDRLIVSLTSGPSNAPRGRNGQRIGERNLLRAADVIAIAELYPDAAIPAERLQGLGQLAATCENEGESPAVLAQRLQLHLAEERPDRKLTKVAAGQLLLAANRLAEALQFLPTLQELQVANDLKTQAILARTCYGLHRQQADQAKLELAWQAVQSVLESPSPEAPVAAAAAAAPAATEIATPPADPAAAQPSAALTAGTAQPLTLAQWQSLQTEVLQLAVELVPQLRKELGAKWLSDSFTREAERGRKILHGIGRAAAIGMAQNPSSPDQRMAVLKLQQTAVDAILQHAAASLDEWKPALHLLLINWLREARYSVQYDTSTARGPQMQRDAYGNYFWMGDNSSAMQQMQMQSQNGMPLAIPAGKLLDAAPGDAWLQSLEPSFFPTFAESSARLHLKVKEESAAFPWIEKLAASHPQEAVELVQTFLSTWTENHDPNSARRRTGVYMFSFGYNERLNSIPLTRSHQERNLRELAGFAERIRKLQLKGVDESWLASAFAGVHSAAEVYLQKDLQAVFGNSDAIQAKTLAVLLGRMRENLGTVWREPQVQQAMKTNRKKQELEAEVLRGYDSALQMCSTGLQQEPGNWRLLMVQGSLLHDLANYRNDLARDAGFADARRQAIAILHSAVDAYLQALPSLPPTDITVECFNSWFYAALGDASLARITPERNPVLEQMPLIQQAFAAIPAEFRDRHLDLFANDLFSRMSSVNPAVKFRYVREGLRIAGERQQAREARQVLDYYSDLVQEIQLLAEVDGSVRVGHGQPFGVLVSIRHSKAIEREGGGFARYLQNQNSGGGYFYNNGRPNEDYRDKFETAARAALDEHFEVLSVTFQPESVQSAPDAADGWRRTPYAWLLLKARGPEIDSLPPLRLDLDFLDTTGYVVLPVESAAVAIDCTPQTGDLRPIEELTVTQILDEREFAAGRLGLEIRAVGRGLVPELEQIVELQFDDFEVTGVETQPLSVSKFDENSARPAVLSERLWTVSLRDRREAAEDARSFRFASLKVEPAQTVYQRYEDADLKATEQTVTLQARWDQPATPWSVWAGLGLVLCAGSLGGWQLLRRRAAATTVKPERWTMPTELTPFSVLAVLQRIESEGGLSAERRRELADVMQRIERHYFGMSDRETAPDLAAELRRWIETA
ncbi:MAG: hypothetical protein ACK45A_17250 [Planctomyces sp.]